MVFKYGLIGGFDTAYYTHAHFGEPIFYLRRFHVLQGGIGGVDTAFVECVYIYREVTYLTGGACNGVEIVGGGGGVVCRASIASIIFWGFFVENALSEIGFCLPFFLKVCE